MSIIYSHSLSLEDLALTLQDSIYREQKANLLRAPIVVIPNPNIERWLKINLTKISPSKLSTNIRYVFLEKIFEEFFLYKEGIEQEDAQKLICRHGEIEKQIFVYLLENRNSERLRFLSKYLESASRIFSLSKKMANYFKDYELNRSFWISEWGKEKGLEIPYFSQATLPSPEAASDYYLLQKQIYSDLFLIPDQTLTSPSRFLLSAVKHQMPMSNHKFNSLHFFCLANLSDTYLGLLAQMADVDKINIHIYQFHTGMLSMPKGTSENLCPVRWSRPQTHMAKSIAARTEKNVVTTNSGPGRLEESKVPKGLEILRSYLQGELLQPNLKLNSSGTCSEDGSLRFWNAPSVYRELEAVSSDILYKMNTAKEKDLPLSLLDFSILLTDVTTYRSAIEWVFDGGMLIETEKDNTLIRENIPYSLVDLKASEASVLYRGLNDFWNICRPDGFKLSELLPLLRNRLLYEGNFDLNDSLAKWEQILDSIGVAYEEDKLISEEDPFLISEGIRRLVLSTIISTEKTYPEYGFSSVAIHDEEVVIQLVNVWDRILLARKSIRSFLKTAVWTKPNLNSVKEALTSLFLLDQSESVDSREFPNFCSNLGDWSDLKLENESDGLDLLKLITKESFDSITIRKGDYLTGGITISLLQPMRPLPFQHVYILGLGEGKFPGTVDRSQLNLRRDLPEEWDLNRREIQESLFWESLYSATVSLTLSYVGKNTKEDKIFEPCSNIFEIMQDMKIEKAVEIPLHAYGKKYTHSDEDKLAGLVSYDYSRTWFRNPTANPARLKEFADTNKLKKVSLNEIPKTNILLSELIQYAKDPMDTYLKKRMDMYISEDETDDDKEELFSLNDLNRSIIQKRVYDVIFPDLVKPGAWEWNLGKIQSILDPIIQEEKLKALFPNRAYTKMEKENILEHFKDRQEMFASWHELVKGGTYYRYLSFGNTGLDTDKCLQLPPLTIGEDNPLKILGEWPHVINKDGVYYWLYTTGLELTPNKKDDNFNKYKDYFGKLLSPFLGWAMFASQGLKLKILPTNQKEKKTLSIAHFDFAVSYPRDSCLRLMSNLVIEFLKDEPTYFSRIGYLNFYCELEKSKTTMNINSIQDEVMWKSFLEDNTVLIVESQTKLVALYPNSEKLILGSSFSFAREFYLPITLWGSK